MVRVVLFLMLMPLCIFGGEFTASVDTNQIHMGDRFTLQLTLKDASTNEAPPLEALKKSFTVVSQQQSYSTRVVNGQMSSSLIWKISLSPLKEGEATIPAIVMNTSQGALTSNPIKISVTKADSTNPNASEANEVTFTAGVSTTKPYKNEPLFLSLCLTSKRNLINVRINPFTIDDAILEQVGEPKVSQKIIDGVRVEVIDVEFLLTPLKTGELKIPQLIVHGEIPVQQKPSRSSRMDDLDPFMMFQGFAALKPFTYVTNELILDVQPPPAHDGYWLPAKSIVLDESWDEAQTLQVGEPISRGFKIVAEGAMSSQLPSLNEQLQKDPHFKIYADKPETGQDIHEQTIRSFRDEQYTLIPQQPGLHTLPEVTLTWWDVNKKEQAIAKIPARTVDIQVPTASVSDVAVAESEMSSQNALKQETNLVQRDPFLYTLVGILAAALVGAIVWIIVLQKKIGRLTEAPKVVKAVSPPPKTLQAPPPVPAKDKKEKLPDLNPT